MIESVLVLRCVPPRQPRRSKTKPTTPLSLSLSLSFSGFSVRAQGTTLTLALVSKIQCAVKL